MGAFLQSKFINPRTTRPKLNGKLSKGGRLVTTRDDIFASQQKNIHVSKKKIIILKILDIVVLLLFTKFKNISFSWNGSDLKLSFLFGILQDFCEFFSILY